MDDRENLTFGHIKVFLLGGLVGAACALLFAPKSGKEMRSDLKDRAGKLKTSAAENWQTISTKGREIVENVAAKSKDAYEKGSGAIHEQKERLGAAYSAGKAAAKDAYVKKEGGDESNA